MYLCKQKLENNSINLKLKEMTTTISNAVMTAQTESTEKSVISNTQVTNKEIGIEELKKGWKGVLEVLYEENLGYIQEELENGIGNCDISYVNRLTEETEQLQDLYFDIEECKTIEDLKEVDLDYLVNNVLDIYILYRYATNYVDDETATAMVELIEEVA